MPSFPRLQTERLLLRQFHMRDAGRVTELAGARELAVTTFLPHPYKNGMAERWILSQIGDYEAERLVNFAILVRESETLIGSIGLELDPGNERAQLGYWIGLPYWNKGYCTEAAQAVVDYGFENLGLRRIHAPVFKSNPASMRVLEKIGMEYEGCQRSHYKHFGKWEDLVLYGMVRTG